MIDSWITVLIEPTVSVFLPFLLAFFFFFRFRLVITQRGWKVIAWREGATLLWRPPSERFICLSQLPASSVWLSAGWGGLVLRRHPAVEKHSVRNERVSKCSPRQDGATVDGRASQNNNRMLPVRTGQFHQWPWACSSPGSRRCFDPIRDHKFHHSTLDFPILALIVGKERWM